MSSKKVKKGAALQSFTSTKHVRICNTIRNGKKYDFILPRFVFQFNIKKEIISYLYPRVI